MTYCVKCGAQVGDEVTICPQCGAVIPGSTEKKEQTSGSQQYSYGYGGGTNGEQYTYGQGSASYNQGCRYDSNPEYFPREEVEKNKVMGVLAYLGILILIPLLAADKNSAYVKQHCNQGIVLFVVSAILDAVSRLANHIFLVGGIISLAADVADLACVIIAIMGIVSAAKGTRKPLPIISRIQVFK